MTHVEIEPNVAASPQEVRYPRAADQLPMSEPELRGPSRWMTALADSLGLVAVVWSIPAAIVIVGLPIALVGLLITWLF